MNRLPLGALLTGTISCLVVGCSDQLPTYPVQGVVQFPSGAPVKTGTVELKSREHGVQARGSIQTDGSFQLTTYEEGDGAVAGVHDCVVVQFVMTEDVAGHRPSFLGVIDPKYASYATSGLSVEIQPEAENAVIIEVEGFRKGASESDAKHDH